MAPNEHVHMALTFLRAKIAVVKARTRCDDNGTFFTNIFLCHFHHNVVTKIPIFANALAVMNGY